MRAFILRCALALCVANPMAAVECGFLSSGRWRLITTETQETHSPVINTLRFTDPGRGFAILTHSFYKTTDGGKTWVRGLDGYGDFYHDLTFVNDRSGWMVGTRTNNYEKPYQPLILRTADGGATWHEQRTERPASSVSLPEPLSGVSFCDLNVGWAVGANMIVHTANGGDSWKVQYLGDEGERLQSVVCVSRSRALAVGNNGLILHTNDGGLRWATEDSGTDKIILKARLFDGTVWAVGRDGTLLHLQQTTGNSSKWIQHRLDTAEALHDIYFSGHEGWLVGSGGTILHTTDGGTTWQKHPSPTNTDLKTLHFINPQNGWAGGTNRTLLRLSK